MNKRWITLTINFILIVFLCNAQEICNNGIDDDNDGLIDLNDKENCLCMSNSTNTSVASLIPNPSFEEYDCIPNFWVTSLEEPVCAKYWERATEATADYMHEGGFVGRNVMPQPFPDGKGAMGICYDAYAKYGEFVGANISSPMKAGTKYTLQYQIAGGSIGYNKDSTLKSANDNLEAIDFYIYGSTAKSTFPLNTTGCPIGLSGFQPLGKASYKPTFNNWTTLTIEFTPSVDINSVIIGGPCTFPKSYIGLNGTPYFVVDNLLLNKSDFFKMPPITIDSTIGSICDNSKKLIAHPSVKNGLYQWYKNGIAIVGAKDSTLNVSGLNLGEGKYTFQNSTIDGSCITSTVNVAKDEPQLNVDLVKSEGCIPFNAKVKVNANMKGTFSWTLSDGSTFKGDEISPQFKNEGDYSFTVTFTSTAGCTTTKKMDKTLHAFPLPTVDFSADITKGCKPLNVNFKNNNSNISSSKWSFSDGGNSTSINANHIFKATGFYDVKLENTSNKGCVNDTIIKEMIEVFPSPTASIVADKTSDCKPINVTFRSESKNAIQHQWTIENSNIYGQQTQHTFSKIGYYDVQLIVTDAKGCTDTAKNQNMINIHALPKPKIYISPAVTTVNNTTISLKGECTESTIEKWLWKYDNESSSEQMLSHKFPEKEGIYPITLVVTDADNCTDSISQNLKINAQPTLFVPNAFSPNGDGTNDYFFAKGLSIENFHMTVFNRWGELIFESNNMSEHWNGTYHGKEAEIEVYVYKIDWSEMVGEKLENKNLLGTVSLVR